MPSINKNHVPYFLSFSLPVTIMVVVYIALGIYPFGEKSLLILDLNSQYVSYFAAYQEAILGNGSFLYTFSKTLGGNMLGLFAYYLASPFNLLLLLFPKAHFTEAILLVTLLKTGFCGLTFAIYLRHTFKRQHLSVVIFSTAYALMAYSIAYQQNLMWLDGVILLPLITLGLNQIISNKNLTLYTITLTAVIITNYYIGYMICLFSVLYFFYKLLLSSNLQTADHKFHHALQRFVTFAFASILAGGMSSFLIIPTLVGLKEGKVSSLSSLEFAPNFPFINILANLYPGSSISYLAARPQPALPYIYSGVLIIILLSVYFAHKNIALKAKILSGIFLAVLLFSFHNNAPNLIWHGFNPPVGFPYRYSFLFSFLLIVFAYEAYIRIDEIRFKPGAVIIVVFFVAIFTNAGQNILSSTLIFATLILAIIYAILLSQQKKRRALMLCFIVILVSCELGYNAFITLRSYAPLTRSSYHSYVISMEPIIDAIKENDPDFFRMEATFRRTHNDSLLLNFSGLTHFSSTYEEDTLNLMEKLGFRNTGLWAYYNKGATITADSLLSIKYILSRFPLTHYEAISQTGPIVTYQNPYALPLGFMVPDTLIQLSMDNPNLFTLQNQITQAMTINLPDTYVPLEVKDILTTNIRTDKHPDYTTYLADDPNQEAAITFIIQSQNTHPIYAYFPTPSWHKVNLRLNNEPFGTYFDTYNYGILALGSYEPGTEIALTMQLTTKQLNISENQFVYLDMDCFNQAYDQLSQQPLNIQSFSNTQITGTVTSTPSKPFLFTSIPYSTGWTVTINNQEAETFPVMDALLATHIPPGTHNIQFRYRPPVFLASVRITLIFAILFLVAILCQKKHSIRQEKKTSP